MNRIIDRINPIYEAIRFLSNRACGMNASKILETWSIQYPGMEQLLEELIRPIAELEDRITANVDLEKIDASGYFVPFYSINTNPCLADTIFSPSLYCGFITDLDELVEKLISMPEDLRTHRFVCSLEPEAEDMRLNSKNFLDFVLSINIDDASKLSVINCYNNYTKFTLEIVELIRPVFNCIKANEELFSSYIEDWRADIETIDNLSAFISKNYNLRIPVDVDYTIFPTFMCGLLFNMTTWKDEYSGSGHLIGEFASSYAMVRYLKALANENTTPRTIEILKGLADETRFELLKCINDEPTYGNALAEKFDMTHQKIFYHMSKMLVPGIVECNAQNGKIYYSINRRTIDELIFALEPFSSKQFD